MRGIDYYRLLGVSREAGTAEIKSAYRSLARTMHPDVGGTARTFRLLREAYETLNDPVRRAAYDRENAAPPRSSAPQRKRRRQFGDDPDFVVRLPRLGPDDIAWWDAVDPSARVRYLPLTGPERRTVLALVTGWSGLLGAGLTVQLGTLLLGIWLSVLITSGAAVVVVLRRHLLAGRAERTFVAEFDRRRVFGLPGVHDERSRQLTADLCARYLTRLPGLRVFHGLSRPDAPDEEIHHAVLCGRRLVLVESKSWLPGHYTTDERGELWRNGHPFRGGITRLPDGIAAFGELLPDVEVCGVVLIYPSRSGAVTTGRQSGPVFPMEPAQFVRDVGTWFAQDPASVDREAFTAVLERLAAA
ncbi:DnaJ domain-containing protein [Saccharopolyspora sp. HNM0983]|uniref:DnaJ domain-containing protein n=1 Tax=Saccharopolyspora montiporae TaxID=2781240 RepID=A0A929BCL1_9PSEU|nr:DnaJ domain-containing protein [Saccharopolyspora sp. HNM0983]